MKFHELDKRKLGLLLTLIVVVGLLLYQNDFFLAVDKPKPDVIVVEDKTASLPLDEGVKAGIQHYFEGLRVPPEQNNLDFAGTLESTGQTQVLEGNDEEAYKIYQKLLAISYQQGSMNGIGTALVALSEVAERGGNQDDALRTAMLGYEVAEARNNKGEMEVLELRLAGLLEKQEQQVGVPGVAEEGGPEPGTLASETEAPISPEREVTESESEVAMSPDNVVTDRESPPVRRVRDYPRIAPVRDNSRRILELSDVIETQVGRFRGLSVGQPITKTLAKREEIEKRLLELAHISNPPRQVELEKKALEKLGLIPPRFDFAEFRRRTSLLSTISLYDPRTKTLYIDDSLAALQRTDEIDKKVVVSLVMSLFHALQDQHFNLTPYSAKVEGNDDASMARLALVLGDALSVLVDYSVSSQLMGPGQVRDVDLSFRQEIESQLGNDAPEALKEMSVFPSVAGFKFMRSFRKWNALEEANRLYSDFPRSTEQLMHPEKYLAQRDDPTVVESQPLPALLPVPWKSVYSNVLGEFSLYLVLNHFIERRKAGQATEGWDGDRLELFEHPGGNLAFVLRSVWDAEEDAREFASAYSDLVQKKYPGAQLVNLGDNSGTAGKQLEWESGGNRIILRVKGSQVEIIEMERT